MRAFVTYVLLLPLLLIHALMVFVDARYISEDLEHGINLLMDWGLS